MDLYEEALGKFSDIQKMIAKAKLAEPTAMTLATCGPDGQPTARVVLLKGFDASGFVFFTNKQSRKGQELAANRKAGLCFFWDPIDVQVRIDGTVSDVSDEEADQYWQTRPRESQVGGWASQQSQSMKSVKEIYDRIEAIEEKYGDGTIPRPPHWSGYRLKPHLMEFWKRGPFRVHEREVYEQTPTGWTKRYLFP